MQLLDNNHFNRGRISNSYYKNWKELHSIQYLYSETRTGDNECWLGSGWVWKGLLGLHLQTQKFWIRYQSPNGWSLIDAIFLVI